MRWHIRTLALVAAVWLAIGACWASAAALVNTIKVGTGPRAKSADLLAVSSDGTYVWATNPGLGTVTEIRASSGRVVRTIKVRGAPYGVSSDGTHVWVTQEFRYTVTEIDASTGRVVRAINVGGEPLGVSSDGTHVWVAIWASGTVSEIDASTGTVVKTINVVGEPTNVSSDGSHVWVTDDPPYATFGERNRHPGTVSEIDASTGTVVKTIKVGRQPNGVSSDGTHVWVMRTSRPLTELDASTGTLVKTINLRSRFTATGPDGVASDGTHVWVAVGSGVIGIDASTGNVVNRIKLGDEIAGVSSDGTHVWALNDGPPEPGAVNEIKITKR